MARPAPSEDVSGPGARARVQGHQKFSRRLGAPIERFAPRPAHRLLHGGGPESDRRVHSSMMRSFATLEMSRPNSLRRLRLSRFEGPTMQTAPNGRWPSSPSQDPTPHTPSW